VTPTSSARLPMSHRYVSFPVRAGPLKVPVLQSRATYAGPCGLLAVWPDCMAVLDFLSGARLRHQDDEKPLKSRQSTQDPRSLSGPMGTTPSVTNEALGACLMCGLVGHGADLALKASFCHIVGGGQGVCLPNNRLTTSRASRRLANHWCKARQ